MSMLIAAFDTATDAIAMGLGTLGGAGVRVESGGYEIAPRNSNSRLLSLLVERLDALGATPADLGAIVCGRGPGSFTGVRIGVATAKGLAQGLGVPLVGVGTLDAIAWSVAASGVAEDGNVIAVAGDAMRGEVYPALFDVRAGSPVRRDPDRVDSPEAVAETWRRELAGARVVLAGNGLRKYGAHFLTALPDAAVADEALWWPSGEGLLAAFDAAGGPSQFAEADPALLLPVYTRLSDAEEAERVRLGRSVELPASGVVDPGTMGAAVDFGAVDASANSDASAPSDTNGGEK